MSTIRRLAVVAGVLVAWVSVASGSAEIIEQIIVKVNGDILTKTDLEARQIAVLRQQGRRFTEEELKKAIAEITPQLLVETIDEMLVIQRGKELGYRLTDEQFKTALENIKKENRIESDEVLEAALKQENMTMADLRRSLEKQMLVSRVQQVEVFGRISITEVEARTYYERHPSEFTTPASLTLREILVAVPGDGKTINVALDEQAQAKVDAIRSRLAAGEPFEKVASEVSDSPSKTSGGLIGPIHRSEIDPSLGAMIDAIKPGQVTEPVRTPRGYLLLKLESVTQPVVRPFEEVREEIADRVAEEKGQAEIARYVEKLRAKAIIEWKNEELKKLYDRRLAELAARGGVS